MITLGPALEKVETISSDVPPSRTTWSRTASAATWRQFSGQCCRGWRSAVRQLSGACRFAADQGSAFSRHAQLPALRVAAIQAGIAAVHHDHGGGAALRAQLRPLGKMRL